jgi:hypothetical protein
MAVGPCAHSVAQTIKEGNTVNFVRFSSPLYLEKFVSFVDKTDAKETHLSTVDVWEERDSPIRIKGSV